MSLVIRHPPERPIERAYVFDVICGDYLGQEFVTIAEDRDDVSVSVAGADKEVRVADVFLRTADTEWLQPQSLPEPPLERRQLPDAIAASIGPKLASIPVLFGESRSADPLIALDGSTIELNLDVFGLAFFMLTRYEEACSDVRDGHGRFPASESLSMRAGLLERPVVDECVEILWACLSILQPNLVRRRRHYQVVLSHDVDRLFDTRGKSWATVMKNAIGDAARRRDIALAAKRVYSKILSGYGNYRREPANTFDFIMDLSEQHEIRSAFYFIAHHGSDGMDGDYTIGMPWVRRLLRRIDSRGHELGLHASYHSYQDSERIAAEFTELQSVAGEEGVSQEAWGGRQHYLRWSALTTWQGWNDAGLAYDSTLGYAEAPGFRAGTCFSYPVFNLRERSPLNLREQPLVTMETTLFSENYMNLPARAALDKIARLSATCREFGGNFTLLWHNDNLITRDQRKLYRDVLEAIT